ncbi:hypothetical protein HDU76_010727 [Blyttiomyces sp. JEL0837]|nr:hypothetical protein HDU76_010727 [Blyttiomyces sp. JEL0837]
MGVRQGQPAATTASAPPMPSTLSSTSSTTSASSPSTSLPASPSAMQISSSAPNAASATTTAAPSGSLKRSRSVKGQASSTDSASAPSSSKDAGEIENIPIIATRLTTSSHHSANKSFIPKPSKAGKRPKLSPQTSLPSSSVAGPSINPTRMAVDAPPTNLKKAASKVKGKASVARPAIPSTVARPATASTSSVAVRAPPTRAVLFVNDSDNEEAPEEIELGRRYEKVVGIQYYRGLTGVNENVMIERDPHNPYDRNAIKVSNLGRQQVGHIPRATALVLAPLIDGNRLRVEGVVTGPRGQYDLPLMLCFYTTVANRALVLAHFERHGFDMAGQRPVVPAPAAPRRNQALEAWESILGRSTAVMPQSSSQIVEQFAMSLERMGEMKEGPQPANLITKLLPYQRQGLHWLMTSEHPAPPTREKVSQFWVIRNDLVGNERRDVYQNLATFTVQSAAPRLSRGCILADDMGLGKTMQVLALICSDPNGRGMVDKPLISDPTYSKTTLVVCPLSVIGNWTEHIDRHVQPGAMTYYVYHGPNKNADPAFLASHDVVITTYTMLTYSKDLQEIRRGLHAVKWRRVVLDEGHNIRNKKTKQAEAACALDAERRIILSGTPIQNSLEDLFSLTRFLRYAPFDEYHWFNRTLTRPVKQRNQTGINNLRILMSQICLRRTKTMKLNGKPILELPPCTLYLHRLQFKYDDEKSTYNALMAEFERNFDLYVDGEGQQSYANILEVLMRLRQTCDHISLLGARKVLVQKAVARVFQRVGKTSGDEKITINDEEMRRLLDILRENAEEDCAVCLDTLNRPVVTRCGHFFCHECIVGVINAQRAQDSPCPMCRAPLKENLLIELPPPSADDHSSEADEESNEVDTMVKNSNQEESIFGERKRSSKIDALVELLQTAITNDPTNKAIVFSQWAKMLDEIEPFLISAGIKFVRCDGNMSRRDRNESINTFKSDRKVHVFLATLKSASEGLNLTEANMVIMTDPWWNNAAEAQAIDRCNRLGQTRPVNVFRLVVQGTVEERVLDVQQRKIRLVNEAFGDAPVSVQQSRGREQRLEDLKILLGRKDATATSTN